MERDDGVEPITVPERPVTGEGVENGAPSIMAHPAKVEPEDPAPYSATRAARGRGLLIVASFTDEPAELV